MSRTVKILFGGYDTDFCGGEIKLEQPDSHNEL